MTILSMISHTKLSMTHLRKIELLKVHSCPMDGMLEDGLLLRETNTTSQTKTLMRKSSDSSELTRTPFQSHLLEEILHIQLTDGTTSQLALSTIPKEAPRISQIKTSMRKSLEWLELTKT